MSIGPFQIRIKDRNRRLVSIDSFELAHNKITFLFGESGIGKTMLAKALYGLLDPSLLEISFNHQDYRSYLQRETTKELQRNSFFVFQEPSSHLNPLLSLRTQLSEGSLAQSNAEKSILKHLWQSSSGHEIEQILDTFPKPYRPSGGEKQRILLAMAFKKIRLLKSGQPSFFVMDEPTGNLDNRTRNLVLELILRSFKQQPFTLLFITHDYSIIHAIFTQQRDLIPQMEFKELFRAESQKIALRTFSAQQYLQWEGGLTAPPRKMESGSTVFSMRHSFSVFGKDLNIYRDAAHKKTVDLQIAPASLSYLKAPSGAGKTTLAKIVMGLIKARKFNAQIADYRLDENTSNAFWQKYIWGKQISMVFQHADESLNLQADIYQSFAGLPLRRKLNPAALSALLDPVFAENVDAAFLKKKLFELSGGQKQRINIMRSLVLNTKLTILDEPLNGLDFHSIQKILQLLEEKRRAGSAFLIISHNDDIFEKMIPAKNIYFLA